MAMFSQIALLNEIPNSYFIWKCDISEVLKVWWERMRLQILILQNNLSVNLMKKLIYSYENKLTL